MKIWSLNQLWHKVKIWMENSKLINLSIQKSEFKRKQVKWWTKSAFGANVTIFFARPNDLIVRHIKLHADNYLILDTGLNSFAELWDNCLCYFHPLHAIIRRFYVYSDSNKRLCFVRLICFNCWNLHYVYF